ncbi:MAG: phosphate/phosphite/phosphonate ABC transporter substrate-binding protein [Methylovulum sp.]|jgi:ABC-type phosphate/phosphonate transport system substrate-binding protein|nr:phosphate/phosphite/phosphonate ABC transporter substrate-binding protein [Methylovulum sp.]MCF8000225.1 phosphate/phosphite/phosphonate ABC transporter substrate-binding protein [Methylovulum sp.]
MIKLKHLAVLLFLLSLLAYPLLIAKASDPFDELSLRVGLDAKSFPDFSQEDLEVSIKLLSEELGKEIGIQTTITVYDDIKAMRTDFQQGIINFVVASSILLVTQFDTQQFTDGFRFVRADSTPDQVLVLSQKKYGKTDLKNFLGKRLVLAKSDPMTELYMDYLARRTFKQGYQKSFKEMPREKKTHQLILKLFFNQADITCVYYNAYQTAIDLNPQLEEQLQIIAHTDNIPQGAGFFHKDVPLEFRESVITQVLKLARYTRGQQLLQLFKSDVAVRSNTVDLLSTKKFYEAYRRLVSGK